MILSAALLILLVYLFWWRNSAKANKGNSMPPGPWGFPIFGHLPLLGLAPHKTLLDWRKKWGPVMTVQFGSLKTVVIQDLKTIRVALNMEEFGGRIEGIFDHVTLRKAFVNAQDEAAIEQREFAAKSLKTFFNRHKEKEEKVQNEISLLLEKFEATQGKPIDFSKPTAGFSACIINSFWSVFNGQSFEHKDSNFENLIGRLHLFPRIASRIGGGAHFMPWLRKLFPNSIRNQVEGFRGCYDFFTKDFQNNYLPKMTLNKPKLNSDPVTFTDAFVNEMDVTEAAKSPSSFYKSLNYYPYTAGDVFMAASINVNTAMEWIMIFLAQRPHYQDKLLEELDGVLLGENRPVSLSDRPRMPFTIAVIYESLRFSSIFPLAIHQTLSDVNLNGYEIPKDTMIVANIHALHYDPEIWGDPQNFRPERFLDQAQQRLQRIPEFIPFSVGKRKCIGEGVAKDLMFLLTASVIQKFKVVCPPKFRVGVHLPGVSMTPTGFSLSFEART